jgi:hypothetical protein
MSTRAPFREEQRFSARVPRSIAWVNLVATAGTFAWLLFSWGDSRRQIERTFRDANSLAEVWWLIPVVLLGPLSVLALLLCAISIWFLTRQYTTTTEVSEEELRVRFGFVFGGLRIPANDIAQVSVASFEEVGGNGRWARIGGQRYPAEAAFGKRGILVRRRNGFLLAIGTENPEGLATAIRSLIAEPTE